MKNSSIGYALPSPLLGAPLSDIPVSPWESYTICSADNCKDNSAVSDGRAQHMMTSLWPGIKDEMINHLQMP